MALPFLPPEQIEETFHHLDRRAGTAHLQALMDYIWRQWIQNPVFPVPNWSVFMLSVRTNNDLEGWHNRLNARVCRTGRVPFYLLLIELYQEATALFLVARLLSEGKMERINRKKTNLLNGKLFQVWSDYRDGQISTSQLLRACSRFYGPSQWSVVWLNLYKMWTVLCCDHVFVFVSVVNIYIYICFCE